MKKPSITKRVEALVLAIRKNCPKMDTELSDDQLKALAIGAVNRWIEERNRRRANA